MFFNLSVRFRVHTSFSSCEYHTPSALKGPLLIFILLISFGKELSFPFSLPSGIISVLSIFNFSHEHRLNLLKFVMACDSDVTSAIKSVVASAIRLIFTSVLFIFIPLIFGSDLIPIAIISATNINNSAEIGHPCLIEWVDLKNLE